jgi:hypothetical protein
MTIDEITRHILERCQNARLHEACQANGDPEMAWGDRFFYAGRADGPDANKQMPFATIVTKDYGEFDNKSHLNRPGVFRLNIGVSPTAFTALFADDQRAPATMTDYQAQDRLFPHPVYAAQHFVCIINPTATTFAQSVSPLIAEACARASSRRH